MIGYLNKKIYIIVSVLSNIKESKKIESLSKTFC